MAADERQAFVRSLARAVAVEEAPDELATFEETAATYFQDRKSALPGRRREEQLGSGTVGLAIVLLPFLLFAAEKVFDYLAPKLADHLWSTFKNRRQARSTRAVSTADKLVAVHDIVVGVLTQGGVPAQRANQIARLMIDKLRSELSDARAVQSGLDEQPEVGPDDEHRDGHNDEPRGDQP
jgi:hypothetical protein